MHRTRGEVESAAKAIVARVPADAMTGFPAIEKAIDRIPVGKWQDFHDAATDDVREILLTLTGES